MEILKVFVVVIITVLIVIVIQHLAQRGSIKIPKIPMLQAMNGTGTGPYQEVDYGTCKCVNGQIESGNCTYPFSNATCGDGFSINACQCVADYKNLESQDCDSLINPVAKAICKEDRSVRVAGCRNKPGYNCLNDGRMLDENALGIYDPSTGKTCVAGFDENCVRPPTRTDWVPRSQAMNTRGATAGTTYGTCKCDNGQISSNNCQGPFQATCPDGYSINACQCLDKNSGNFGCGNKPRYNCLNDGRMLDQGNWGIYTPRTGKTCYPGMDDRIQNNPANCPRIPNRTDWVPRS